MPSPKELRLQLADLTGLSNAETAYRARMLELCSAQDPFGRSHFNPGHFTASAFVLSADRSALLLIFHGKLKLWVQPGGHVELADVDMASAARREAQEECCLQANELELLSTKPFDLDIHLIPARKDEPAHEHFDVRYLFRCLSENAQAGSDAQDLRYVPLNKISELQSDASVMRAVERLARL
jgi:ADP-ribose pyrophosphatase YjhB (NUDIX family)